MLLRLNRGITAGRDERGSVMIAVIGLLAVTTIITVTISVATVRALSYTSLTRANVQSTAAADAGIDAMLAAVTQNACPASAEMSATLGDIDPDVSEAESGELFYEAIVFFRNDPAGSWSQGCPANSTAQIRIQSTGYAATAGISQSASGADVAAAEAVYDWQPGVITGAASGAAVFSYGSPGLSNNLDLLEFNGAQANLMVREGNINCSNSVHIEGDIIARNGNITLSNSCSAEGDVWASGTVTLNNNHSVGRDLIAVGSGASSISNQTRVGGRVLTGGSLNRTDSQIRSSTGATEVRSNQPGLPLPEIPEWVDVDFVPGDWTSAGWNIVTYAGPCNIDNNDPRVLAWNSYTTPTVVDMRGCSNVIFSTSLNIRADITFIMPKQVSVENFNVRPYLNQQRVVRFITPDTEPDKRPTTAGCGIFNINNRNVVLDPVRILVYTPCDAFSSNQLNWRGQFYAGRMSFSNNSTVTFVPVGIPGYNLNGDLAPPAGGGGTATQGTLGDLVEYRSIDPSLVGVD